MYLKVSSGLFHFSIITFLYFPCNIFTVLPQLHHMPILLSKHLQLQQKPFPSFSQEAQTWLPSRRSHFKWLQTGNPYSNNSQVQCLRGRGKKGHAQVFYLPIRSQLSRCQTNERWRGWATRAVARVSKYSFYLVTITVQPIRSHFAMYQHSPCELQSLSFIIG